MHTRPWILAKAFKPKPHENRLKHVGDVYAVLKRFEKGVPNIIEHMRQRYSIIKTYIKDTDFGVEIGAGNGLSRKFLGNNYYLTDNDDLPWLDYKNVDALSTGFNNEQFNFIIINQTLHHIANPMKFFEEAERILKPGGYLLIIDPNTSLIYRLVVRIMRHEGWDYDVDVFNKDQDVLNHEDLWDANMAMSNLLFDDHKYFEHRVPGFKIVYHTYYSFFTLLNSGGTVAQTAYIPLPSVIVKALIQVDKLLSYLFPKIFACEQTVVLQKRA